MYEQLPSSLALLTPEGHNAHMHHVHLQSACQTSHLSRTVKPKLCSVVFAVVIAEMKDYFPLVG